MANVIRGDPAFAQVYPHQDRDRYRIVVSGIARLRSTGTPCPARSLRTCCCSTHPRSSSPAATTRMPPRPRGIWRVSAGGAVLGYAGRPTDRGDVTRGWTSSWRRFESALTSMVRQVNV